jgi:NRPS condensation-like uncharacterized protein
MTPRRYKAALKDFFYQSGRGTGKGSSSDQQIRFVIQFDGQLDLACLEKAVHAMMYIDPILGCRFVETGMLKGYWEWRKDIDNIHLCEVIPTDAPQAAIDDFLTDLRLPEDAPLFKVRIVRTATADTLCLRVDHRLADGGGTKAIAHLLAETYRRIVNDPELQFGPSFGRFRKRTVIGLTHYHGPVQSPINDGFKPHPSPFFIPKTGVVNQNAHYALRVIEPEDFLRLKAFGKTYGATINDLILTALLRALQPFSRSAEDEPLSVQVSCDYRFRLPKTIPEPICNLFGANFPALVCSRDEPFQTTLKKAAAVMAELRQGFTIDQAIKDELQFRGLILDWAQRMGWPPVKFGDAPTHVILSNFVTQDESRLDFGIPVKDALQLGTVSLGREFMLCASTFRNRLTLSHGYCQSDIDTALVEGIMDRIAQQLRV